MIKRYASSLALPVLLLGAALTGCLFDKPEEEVQLNLTKVPAEAERLKVTAVDAADTSKVLANLFQGDYQAGKALKFPLGKASGKDWMLKVEAFRRDYRVYLSLVPSGKGGVTDAEVIPIGRGLPGVVIDSIKRDGDSITFYSSFRNTPDTLHWHLNPGADSVGDKRYIISYEPNKTVAAAIFDPGSLITFDLHEPGTHALFPVQEADTMLADEAIGTAKSAVEIVDAYTEADSAHIVLNLTNFGLPLVDEPMPGRGFPYVLEKSTFKRLKDFRLRKSGDITHLTAPAWALHGVGEILVALHYADNMRVRPLVADNIDAAQVLLVREKQPSVKILSHSINGDELTLTLKMENAQGYHTHIYPEKVTWPGATNYNTCHDVTCPVSASVWKEARKLVVAVQQDETHNLLRPIVTDSLILKP